MGKRITTLYVDDDLIEIARAKRINLSAFFNNVLNAEFEVHEDNDATSDAELINKLRARLSLMTTELQNLIKENGSLSKEVKELKFKNFKLKEKNGTNPIELTDL